jgi:3-hydroxyacyl-CoA dehydrogenase/enoyl-CoA hydratase/3-hydroxybutyryl-CoA epimerase
MVNDHNIKTALGADGILLAIIDMPGRAMNVFSADMMDSLEKVLDEASSNKTIQGLILTSGKETFLAGADLQMIRMFTDRAQTDSPEQLHELCGRLGRLFLRLEQLPKPTVAALNGLALGGGLELALACDHRIACDDGLILLGLPEVKLGLLPGAGGTQRLPRLVGIQQALEMLLTGTPVSPRQALKTGLINQVCPHEELIEGARQLILHNEKRPSHTLDESHPLFSGQPSERYARVCESLGIDARQRACYPAYDAILDCVSNGFGKPMNAATDWEMQVFVRLIRNPVAGNMVKTLFLDRQKALKQKPETSFIDARIAVIGDELKGFKGELEKRKAPIIDSSQATEGDIVLLEAENDRQAGHQICWLTTAADSPIPTIGFWLSPKNTHGRAAEIFQKGHAHSTPQRDAALRLAQLLGASPLLTCGQQPLLPRLSAAHDKARQLDASDTHTLLSMSLIAVADWSIGVIVEPELVDVAAVSGGLFPAYSGGPFKFLRTLGLKRFTENVAECRLKYPQLLADVPASTQFLEQFDKAG